MSDWYDELSWWEKNKGFIIAGCVLLAIVGATYAFFGAEAAIGAGLVLVVLPLAAMAVGASLMSK